ncbi:MAG: hypothetical protein K2W91_14855 [Novosphingobium sp.]|uniref:hypothetical protein n=1 Tax=Novosphingobium sp. CCH12-A3 TaxID=1768752 RepID=UPI000782FDE0|nr:hypothetical protein [Novosphingobium sp. CCH12-A3]MBX9645362.1 hypothetical protein [Novosphingobium sp.]
MIAVEIPRQASFPGWPEYVIVRMLRRWTVCRDMDLSAMPLMVDLASELGATPQVAVVLASLFQLTEGAIGRPLQTKRCCSKEFTCDERAVLLLLTFAPAAASIYTSVVVPHGLEGPLACAVTSVRMALRADLVGLAPPAGWPFFPPSARRLA